jgi:hemolysin activation/secretion protein
VESRIQAAYPLRVWDRGKEVFYSLGGVQTVRGHEPASIHAYRYAIGSVDIRPALFRRLRVPLRAGKARARIHRFRLLFLADAAATQDSSNLQSAVKWHTGAGAGLSLILSGKRKNHARMRVFMAWPLEADPAPIFYWQTSLFSLAGE